MPLRGSVKPDPTPPPAHRKPAESPRHRSLLIPGSSPARVFSCSHFCPRACSSSSQTVVWFSFPLAQALSLRRIRMALHRHGHDPSPRRATGLRPTILHARARSLPLWRGSLRQLLRAIDCGRAVGGHGRAADAVSIQRLRPGGQ